MIWHVSSRSGEVSCELLYSVYLYLYLYSSRGTAHYLRPQCVLLVHIGSYSIEVIYDCTAVPCSPFTSKAYDSSAIKCGPVPLAFVDKPVDFNGRLHFAPRAETILQDLLIQ